MRLNHLIKIIPDYEGYLIDLWGVLHNGEHVFPQAILALAELKARQKKVILLSNSPRRVHSAESRLTELGIHRHFYDELYTSGEDCFQELNSCQEPKKLRRCYFHIGAPQCMAHELSDMKVTSLEAADFILVTGTNDRETDIARYTSLLKKAHALQLPMICANPDLTVLWGNKTVICAGAIAQHYEEIGGTVRYHGKPFPRIYHRVMEKLFPLPRTRILAIGDSLRTDIKGASQFHLDTLLVLSGIHSHFQDHSTQAIQDYGVTHFQVKPTYIASRLQL